MKTFRVILVVAFALLLCGLPASAKDKGTKKVQDLPVSEQVALAESAAPGHISKDATIMVFGKDGKLMEARKGTNGYTCIPDMDGQEVPDPGCGDQASMQWMNDYLNKAPKPGNTVPGITYMARGGWHWEKNGKVLMHMDEMAGAKRVKEPPHWMVLWPFDPKLSGLPVLPGKFGTYIMFEGTPFAHLMIYQDPMKIGR
jgi:hypothetical protein